MIRKVNLKKSRRNKIQIANPKLEGTAFPEGILVRIVAVLVHSHLLLKPFTSQSTYSQDFDGEVVDEVSFLLNVWIAR